LRHHIEGVSITRVESYVESGLLLPGVLLLNFIKVSPGTEAVLARSTATLPVPVLKVHAWPCLALGYWGYNGVARTQFRSSISHPARRKAMGLFGWY